ncbi:MAG: CoA-binding protein [Nanoarchaeota archaeon]
MKESINTSRTYAVAGASADTSKYGYKVFSDLKKKGCTVIPINPKGGVLEGIPVATDITSIASEVDVLVVVTRPHVTDRIVRTAISEGIRHIWMQPGSFNDDIIEYCDDHDIKVIAGACIMTA